jgi:Parvulin-like peptidyl-prolyl isomerase
MFSRLSFPLPLLGLALFFALAGAPELSASRDRIVAVVNGEVITLKQLDNRVGAVSKSRQASGLDQATLREKVLESLIEQELINQAAKAKGVFVTESDISQALESIKQENNLNDAQFRASLAQSGTTMEAFRDDLRVELLRNRVLGAQVMSKIVVTDSEIRAFLRGEGPDLGAMGGASGNDHRPVRLIILPLDPKNKTRALAEGMKIKREIESGLSFAEAAAKYSQGPGRDNGGDTGDGTTVDKLPPPLQAALAQKKSGEPIDPVEAGGNALIIISAVGDPETAAPASGSKSRKKGKDDPNEFSADAMESGRRQLERYKMQERYGEWINDLKRKAIIRNNL